MADGNNNIKELSKLRFKAYPKSVRAVRKGLGTTYRLVMVCEQATVLALNALPPQTVLDVELSEAAP